MKGEAENRSPEEEPVAIGAGGHPRGEDLSCTGPPPYTTP